MVRSDSTMIAREAAFSEGAVASSRSSSTWSAAKLAALACMRALLPGTERHERCGLRESNDSLTVVQPPTTNHQPPTTNHQPPTTNDQPSTHQPPTTNHRGPTTDPSTTDDQPPTTNHQPS